MYISNSIMNTLINLDNIGILDRDMEKDAMSIRSLGNEYCITVKREYRTLFLNDNKTIYKCSIKFTNIFDQEVVTLLCNEIEMNNFLDVIYFFLENENQQDAIYNLYSINHGTCMIRMSRDTINTYTMYIIKMDNYNECLCPIAAIKFNDELISTFIDILYFICLIDIDDTGKMAKVYRYIDPDLRIGEL